MQNQVAQSMKNSIKVYLVNSFTRDHCGGNPAGVVLNPPKLTTEQKSPLLNKLDFLKRHLSIRVMTLILK